MIAAGLDDLGHEQGIGGVGKECPGDAGFASDAAFIDEVKVPAEDHDARACHVEFSYERGVVTVAGDEHADVVVLEPGQFVGFESQGDVDAFFAAFLHGPIMGGDAVVHEDVFELPLALQPALLLNDGRWVAPAEIVRIDDLAEGQRRFFAFGDEIPNEEVQPGDAQASADFVAVGVVVADVVEIMAVVEDADFEHRFCHVCSGKAADVAMARTESGVTMVQNPYVIRCR